MLPYRQGKVGYAPNKVTASVDCEVKVRHVPDGGGGNFGKYCEGGTASVSHEGNRVP